MKVHPAFMLICSCLASFSAIAQMPTGTQATLSAPIAKASTVIVNDRPWQCDGQICRGASGESRFDDQRSCRDVAQKIGAVASFESAKGALASDDLARCNKYARSSR